LLRRLLPILGVVVAPLMLVVGIFLGGHPSALPDFIRDPLVDDGQGRVYEEATDRIAADYYKKVSQEKLLDTSLLSAVESLKDPFSHYFDPKTYREFQEQTAGKFEGVGMTVQQHPRGLEVMQVFAGGPAAKAGLKRGDLITAVDGKSIKGKASEASTALIKGPSGTTVRLGILSKKVSRTLTIERAAVDFPVVDSRIVRDGARKVVYVSLESFTSGAHGEVGDAVRKGLKQGATSVVLDLRDNGGGLLQEAVLISSIFIPDGTIVTTRGRSQPSHTFEATGKSIDAKVKVVVLVNRGSASASEIVTGALQDRDRATVVGETTFGKGVFQQVEELTNGGALDITVGEYFTPKGRNLGPRDGKRGIAPDVKAVDKAATPKVDEALQAALKVLRR
jgi:carboxyl-terminal processing protease